MPNVIHGTSAPERLDGTAGDDEIYGHEGDDQLFGFGGHDILDGGTGADAMTGGAGDDWYFVDNIGDSVIENASEGADWITTTLDTFSLAGLPNVEYLSGSDGDQTLIGNDVRNGIDGGLGADTMIGGQGDDYYFVDNAGDVVVENAGEGTDTIATSLGTFSIESMPTIENLHGDYGTDDNLTGNSGNNEIIGWTGADTMIGLAGDDQYFVDNAGDVVIEGANAGLDRITASVDYTLAQGESVEMMDIDGGRNGTGSVSLTGNEIRQVLYGNAGDNVLSGGGGIDTLHGYAGNDTLIGGAGFDKLFGGDGADTFVFDTFDSYDAVQDFTSGEDHFFLDQGLFSAFAGSGTLAADQFTTGRAMDGNDHIIYNEAKGNIYYDADGNGPDGAILFAHVDPGTVLTAGDFMFG